MDRFKNWWVAAAALGLVVVGIGMVRLAPAPRPKVPAAPPVPPAPAAPAPRTNDFAPVNVQAPDDGVQVVGQVLDAAGKPVGKAQVALASTQQVTLANAECTEDGRPLLGCDSPQLVQAVAGHLRDGKGVVVAAATTVADAQGRFRFERLAGPSFSVWATAEGHGAAVRERVLPGEAVQVVLPQPRTVRGSVAGEDGKPVAGAKVTVFSRRLPIPAAATTNAEGAFSVAGLGEGPFYAFAEAEGRLAAAVPFVEAGESVRLRLPSPRTLEITTRADGQPVAASVRVQSDHVSREVPADGSGMARITGLPPGEVTVVAFAGERASLPQRVDLAAAGAVPLALDLVPAGSLKVTVTGDFGQAVLDSHVVLSRPWGAPLLEKHSRMGEPLALGPVARGDYVLRVSAR
ncbi:MAG: carboxypeptidase regulatory-like domain-containing protein, partial [Deltaproteobacteria bacterium]|nr:carboxypeptidase regulatory-like domain-containing protein [Deltaproteobacteria bacterium]